MNETDQSLALRVSRDSILGNCLLSLAKLLAGIFGRSGAMISDAVHSLSDVLSTLVVIAGVRMASRGADDDHEYGHERLESVAAVILSVFLFFTGAGIGLKGVRTLAAGPADLAVPGVVALAAAVFSIALKEFMFRYTRRAALRIGSGALMADAWHHRSDALSSVGSLVGIAGARMGFPLMDPAASVVISLFILKAAVDIFLGAIDQMTDHACDKETADAIRACAQEQPGVCAVDLLRTRLFGSRVYVDVEISCAGDIPLTEAHDVAERVHDAIEARFPTVKHCMVHVNPAGEAGSEIKTQDTAASL